MHVQSANLADDSKLKSDQLYKVLKGKLSEFETQMNCSVESLEMRMKTHVETIS